MPAADRGARENAVRDDAIKAVAEALRRADPGGFLSPHGHASVAVDALRSLPVEQRMEAMGMRRHQTHLLCWVEAE